MSAVVQIHMQGRALEMRGGHSHTCPECYSHVPCEALCSVEPDLDLNDGTIRGDYVVCEPCCESKRNSQTPREEGAQT